MKINNLNYDRIEYKGHTTEEQISMKEILNRFYAQVRQQMPIGGDFNDIQTIFAKDDKGEYFLTVETFKSDTANKNINNLILSYVPENKDFKISMRVLKGSKQEILDYLGNELNLNEIKSLMMDLRKRTDEK